MNTPELIHQWRMKQLMKMPENKKLAVDRLSKQLDEIKKGLPTQRTKPKQRGIDFTHYLNLKK